MAKELREKFILHWQSVRPVPVITIDFGDGRKIRRTITGNSIHYVLKANGKVVDGIPGLNICFICRSTTGLPTRPTLRWRVM